MNRGKWALVQDSVGNTLDVENVPIHIAQVKTGKVLLFSGDDEHWREMDAGKSRVWDPENNTLDAPQLGRNLFCAGHCILADGRVLTAGGARPIGAGRPAIVRRGADRDIHTFDPDLEAWEHHEPMDGRRWYPTCTTLPSGRALIVSGERRNRVILRGLVNRTSEVFDPETNRSSRPLPFLHDVTLYPFVHVLPGGFLFVHYRDTTRLFNWHAGEWLPKEFKTIPLGSKRGTHTYDGTGGCVILPLTSEGRDRADRRFIRILLAGGSSARRPDANSPATRIAQIFEFNPEEPLESRWRATGAMNRRRFMSDATLLANGEVLISGGAGRGKQGESSKPVLEAELYDPMREGWAMMAPLNRARLYHSGALLLRDGRVVASGSTGHGWGAGGSHPGSDNDRTLEVFSPVYCAATGPGLPGLDGMSVNIGRATARSDAAVDTGGDGVSDLALRSTLESTLPVEPGTDPGDLVPVPVVPGEDAPGPGVPRIELVPPRIDHGEPVVIEVSDPEAVAEVFALRAGSTTHTLNTDQRCIELPIQSRSPGSLEVDVPGDAWVAPPGPYMVFLVDQDGCVSEGEFVTITVPEWAQHPCYPFIERQTMLLMAQSALDLELEATSRLRCCRRRRIRRERAALEAKLVSVSRDVRRCAAKHGEPLQPSG